MICCSVSSWSLPCANLKRERRSAPLNLSKADWSAPSVGASPSLTIGVSGLSSGVSPGGE
jgi:hypothetical protein